MQFLEWLLPTTEKFPKRVRFTFADRINLRLEKLRILLRLSYRMHYLPHQGYDHAAGHLNDVGRMLGS